MAQNFRTKRRDPNAFRSAPLYPAPDAGQGRSLRTLVDTPSIYGQPGEIPIVNADQSGMEWGTGNPGASTFLDLTDTPGAFGTDGQILIVSPAEDALIFTNAPVSFPEAPQDGTPYARQDGTWVTIDEFSEAPQDGNTYGRNNGAWAEVDEFVDAPSDGSLYARQDGAWEQVPDPGIADAPSDGTLYARQDGAWEQVPPDTDTWIEDKLAAGNVTINENSDLTLELSKINLSVANADLELGSNNALLRGLDIFIDTNDFERRTWSGSRLYKFPDNTPGSGEVLQGTPGNPQILRWAAIEEFVDAPSDGDIYGRKNGAWEIISEFPEAPQDGTPYARQDAGWVTIDEFVDAPSNGTNYGRKDGSWAAISEFPEAPQDGSRYSRQDAGWTADPIQDDAPSNGSLYARQDGDWTSFEEFVDAPSNGNTYGRNNGAWVQVDEFVDAPSDGSLYARQDGAWEVVPSSVDEWLDDKLAAGNVVISRITRNFEMSLNFLNLQVGNAWLKLDTGDASLRGVEILLRSDTLERQTRGGSLLYKFPNNAPSSGQVLSATVGNPTTLEWATPSTGIGDAPSNGNIYGRKDGAWVLIPESLTDAPSNGNLYARQNGAWVSFEEFIDAPSNGTLYARQDGAWEPVPDDTWLDDKLTAANVNMSHRTRNMELELKNLQLQSFDNLLLTGELDLTTTGDTELYAHSSMLIRSRGDMKLRTAQPIVVANDLDNRQYSLPLAAPQAGEVLTAGSVDPKDLEWSAVSGGGPSYDTRPLPMADMGYPYGAGEYFGWRFALQNTPHSYTVALNFLWNAQSNFTWSAGANNVDSTTFQLSTNSRQVLFKGTSGSKRVIFCIVLRYGMNDSPPGSTNGASALFLTYDSSLPLWTSATYLPVTGDTDRVYQGEIWPRVQDYRPDFNSPIADVRHQSWNNTALDGNYKIYFAQMFLRVEN